MDKREWMKSRESENKYLEDLIDKLKNMTEDEYLKIRYGINEFFKSDKDGDVL